MAKLKETTTRYDEFKAELNKSLDEIEQKIQNGNFETVSVADAQAHTVELKAIIAETDAQVDKIESLKVVAEELLAILEALECRDTPKGRDIENTVQTVEDRFSTLQQTIQTKQKKFDDKVFQSFQQWVQKTKKQFNEMKPVSVDRDTLNEQIQTHRDITSEIESHLIEINTMKERHQEKAAQVKKYKTLTDNLTMLSGKAKERGDALEKIIQKLEPFHLAVYQLESWYSYAVHALKQERIDMEFLFTKIDNVYEQRDEKKASLETITTIRDEMTEDGEVDDGDKLQNLVDDLHTKWNEVGQQLVRLVSSAAVVKIDSFSKFFEKVGKELEAAETPSQEADIVIKQYTDHQTQNNDLKSNFKTTVDVVMKYKNMFKTLSGEEPTEIQLKWSAVQKEYQVVAKRSEERLGVLEEAQPAQLSAEIDMDEVLQDWIEVDTVEGDLEKKKRVDESKSTKNKSTNKNSRQQPKKKADVKRHGGKIREEKKPEVKKKDEKSHVKAEPKSEVTKKKEEIKKAPVKKEDKKTPVKKDNKKTPVKNDTKKTPVVKEGKVVEVKKDDKKSVAQKDNKQSDSKTGDEKTVVTEKNTSSKADNSNTKDKENNKHANKEKLYPVELDRRVHQHRNAGNSKYGIVITHIKDNIGRTKVMDFVRPHTKKLGLVRFMNRSSKDRYIFVGLPDQETVRRVVHKLDGRTLSGKRVSLKKAVITYSGGKDKPKKSESDAGTIFDTPQGASDSARRSSTSGKKTSSNQAAAKGSRKQSETGKSKPSCADKKGTVLTLEEIKKSDHRERLAQTMKKKREERQKKQDASDKRSGSRKSGGRKVVTLSELRASRRRESLVGHRRTMSGPARLQPRISPRHSPPRMNMMPRHGALPPRRGVDRQLEPSKELERERQRVWLEHERLERERLQAERERVALERERQRRSMSNLNIFHDEDVRRAMKRGPSPGSSSAPRNDGSYWMPPKRPVFDRDFREGADIWPARRQINTCLNDHTLSHLRFDDMRPKAGFPLSGERRSVEGVTRQVIDAPGLSSHEIRRNVPLRRSDEFPVRRLVDFSHRRGSDIPIGRPSEVSHRREDHHGKGTNGTHPRSSADDRHVNRWPRGQGAWS